MIYLKLQRDFFEKGYSMFNFIKNQLKKIYENFTHKIKGIFGQQSVNEETLKELEKILIHADVGVKSTRAIIDQMRNELQKGTIIKGADLKDELKKSLSKLISAKPFSYDADIYLLVGINGTGKTTFAGKLGYWLKQQNKTILFVAGDTFRAAAAEQLTKWADDLHAQIIIGSEHQDPSSVIFKACELSKKEHYDSIIVDTAGRLQTKTHLMKELEKIKRTINKQLPHKKISTLLVIDAMLGQNSLEQAQLFNESTSLDGIVLTKLDGTGKGGIIFAINQTLSIPVAFISFGEKIDQLSTFNAQEYIDQLLD